VHSIGGSTRKSFYPLGDIVDSYQGVLIALRVREWYHEIDTLYIKDVDLEVQSQWHCIPCIDIPMLLTSAAAPNKGLGIIIHGWHWCGKLHSALHMVMNDNAQVFSMS
jgi:hypothetical protein